MSLISLSGQSSLMYLQNAHATSSPMSQPLPLALAVLDMLLGGRGAYRVHGAGFAGSVQAFISNDLVDVCLSVMESVFGRAAAIKRRYGRSA